MNYERDQRGAVEPDPGMARLGLSDPPVAVAIIVLGALLTLGMIRVSFSSVVISV